MENFYWDKLSIKQLESLLPSIYEIPIKMRIEELQNANTKVKRSTETTITKRN